MLISDGTLTASGGEGVDMSEVADDTRLGNARKHKERPFWTYVVAGKHFAALPIHKVVEREATSSVFEIKTEKGDTIILPGGAKLLMKQHGIDTTMLVASMSQFRTWNKSKLIRAKTFEEQDPEKYEDSIISLRALPEEMTEVEQTNHETGKVEVVRTVKTYPVYEVGGAAGVARLLVINGFLVG